jgi:hypothetical protein
MPGWFRLIELRPRPAGDEPYRLLLELRVADGPGGGGITAAELGALFRAGDRVQISIASADALGSEVIPWRRRG